jgi:hypothetical protein
MSFMCMFLTMTWSLWADEGTPRVMTFDQVEFGKLPDAVQKTLIVEAPEVLTATKITDRTGKEFFRAYVNDHDGNLQVTLTLDAFGTILSRIKAPPMVAKPPSAKPAKTPDDTSSF